MPVYWESDERLVELNEALDQLAEVSPRLAEIVQYRFFAGYSEAETGALMGITDRTVRRDWVKAKALLLMFMQDGEGGEPARDTDLPL